MMTLNDVYHVLIVIVLCCFSIVPFAAFPLQSEQLQPHKAGLSMLASLLHPGAVVEQPPVDLGLAGGKEGEGEEENERSPIDLSLLSGTEVGCQGVWGPRAEIHEFLRAQLESGKASAFLSSGALQQQVRLMPCMTLLSRG